MPSHKQYERRHSERSSESKSLSLLLLALFALTPMLHAQKGVAVTVNSAAHRVNIAIDGAPFTSYLWATNQRKPILYPLIAPDGTTLTRGNPPLPGERTDHPHHAGLWFNYSNVNNIDYWNNSDAIKPEAPRPLRLHRPRPHRLRQQRPHLRRTRHRIHLVSRLRRPHRRQQPAAAHPPPDHALRLLQTHHRRQARPRHRHDRHTQGPANLSLPRRQGRHARHPRRPLPRIRHRQARGPARRQRHRNPRRCSHRRRHRRLPHQRRQGRRRSMGHARPLVRALRHHPCSWRPATAKPRPSPSSTTPQTPTTQPTGTPATTASSPSTPLARTASTPKPPPCNFTLDKGASATFRYRIILISGTVSPEALNLQSDAFNSK